MFAANALQTWIIIKSDEYSHLQSTRNINQPHRRVYRVPHHGRVEPESQE